MSSLQLPKWLTDQHRTRARRLTPLRHDVDALEPGQIWQAEATNPGAGRRFVVLLEVDLEVGTASIALVSNVVEAASERDLVLSTEVTSLPFEAMVEGDVIGPIWVDQLVGPVSVLPPEYIEPIRALDTASYGALPGIWRGLPLQGQNDWRVAFKQSEVRQLHELGADCVRFLLSDDLPICDPMLLMPDAISDQEAAYLFDLIARRATAVSAETPIRLLRTPGYQDAWVSRFGWDAWSAVQMLFQIQDQPPKVDGNGMELLRPQRVDDSDPEALTAELKHWISPLRNSVSLATSARFWADRPATRRAHCSYQVGSLRAHVVREMAA